MRSKPSTGINVGGSSILVVFVLLCLTTFATLAMVSASANYRLAQRVVASTDAFYEADSRAEVIFAELSAGHLMDLHRENNLGRIGIEISRPYVPEGTATEVYFHPVSLDYVHLSYSIRVDDSRSLEVVLRYHYSEQTLDVIEWRVVAQDLPADFGVNPPSIWVGG